MASEMVVEVLGKGSCENETFPRVLILAYQPALLSVLEERSEWDWAPTKRLDWRPRLASLGD